ncbi:MAG TPA: hydrolase, partial [Gordonia polyisoprenivorans]|nr:hydrolase [Gordonia polyisoprenivorans]
PTDAMTDSSAERHAHSVESIFPQIAETGSTADVLALIPTGVTRPQ